MTNTTDSNKIQQEIFDWIMDSDAYELESDEEGTESYASTDHKLWVNAHSSTLAIKVAKSLESQSVYAKTRAVIGSIQVHNLHNPQLNSKVMGSIYRVSKQHFFGNGRVENTAYGVFVLTNETNTLLRVKIDKARTSNKKPVFVTSDKQYPTIHNDTLYYNIAPLRVVLRGIRQFGINHLRDNKADGSDNCLNACLMAQIADNADMVGVYPNMK